LIKEKHNPLLQGCRLVYDCYERLARLDEGTYGVVWKARDTNTNEMVALKQIKFDTALMKEGFPLAALREIGVLLDLSHKCIVTVKEMVVGNSFDKVFMVMEVCSTLSKILTHYADMILLINQYFVCPHHVFFFIT